MVGHFNVSGLQRLPKGVHVTLAINSSGLLEVCFVCSPALTWQDELHWLQWMATMSM